MSPLECPVHGESKFDGAKYCLQCGALMIDRDQVENPEMGSPASMGVVSSSPSDSGIIKPGIHCYKCDSKEIVGRCISDKRSFCSDHGVVRLSIGFCRDCINAAHYKTPWTIKIFSWMFYLLSIYLFLIAILMVIAVVVGIPFLTDLLLRHGHYLPIIFMISPQEFHFDPRILLAFCVPFIAIVVGGFICREIGKRISDATNLGIAAAVVVTVLFLLGQRPIIGIILLCLLIINIPWFIKVSIPVFR